MKELFQSIQSTDFLDFDFGKSNYSNQLHQYQSYTHQLCAVRTFLKDLESTNHNYMEIQFNFNFLGGSLGCAETQKIILSLQEAENLKIPVILLIQSGGVRMQEGVVALHGMPILCSALSQFRKNNLLISVSEDPCFGGVAASILSESDIIIGMENTRIGFAGREVVKNTIFAGNQDEMDKQLTDGFQTSERCNSLGQFDIFIQKENLQQTINSLLKAYHSRVSSQFKSDECDSAEVMNFHPFTSCRLPERPQPIDYARNIFTLTTQFASDPSMLFFLAKLDNVDCMIILTNKSNPTDPLNGLGTPLAYRQSAKMAQIADKLNLPIFTIIDTSGALPGPTSEDQNINQAISHCLTAFSSTRSFICSIITGEGGSGGAIAIGAGNCVGCIEKSFYNVISPEGAVSILGSKSGDFMEQCHEIAKTQSCYPQNLQELGVVDGVIRGWDDTENRNNCAKTSSRIKQFLVQQCNEMEIWKDKNWSKMRFKRNCRLLKFQNADFDEFKRKQSANADPTIKKIEVEKFTPELNLRKVLSYLAEKSVQNRDINFDFPDLTNVKLSGRKHEKWPTAGSILASSGPNDVIKFVKEQKQFLVTDTSFRDAHQSLFATRFRTKELLQAGKILANSGVLECQNSKFFSVEVWGGATFDTSYRFLKECPWERLQKFKELFPNTLTQALFRGKNAVGYTSYPDNIIENFIIKSAENGLDLFRIFDAFNDLSQMELSVNTVLNKTNKLCEVCICYTGVDDVYSMQYYKDKVTEIVNKWPNVHILCLKDMSGLMQPSIAYQFFIEMIQVSKGIPFHFHTHDTSGVQCATIQEAIRAGVNIVDLASNCLSGGTSQPPLQSFLYPYLSDEQNSNLLVYNNYWECLAKFYDTTKFNSNSNIYKSQIPGGQISNLKDQCKQMGLLSDWCLVEEKYRESNEFLGGIIKVTPSSKAVGDLSLFMVQNHYNKEDLYELNDLPESIIQLISGDLGFPHLGFPENIQKFKCKTQQQDKQNLDIQQIKIQHNLTCDNEVLSIVLYPDVFLNYRKHLQQFGQICDLGVEQFFYGMRIKQQITFQSQIIELKRIWPAEFDQSRKCEFLINGQQYFVTIHNKQETNTNFIMASGIDNEIECGVLGIVQKVMTRKGMKVKEGDRLFKIISSKLEIVISAKLNGVINEIHVEEGQKVVPGCLLGKIQ